MDALLEPVMNYGNYDHKIIEPDAGAASIATLIHVSAVHFEISKPALRKQNADF